MSNSLNWIEVREVILTLDELCSADEVLEALEQLKHVEHWFDRKRAAVFIARRLNVNVELIERLFVGVAKDDNN